MDEKTLLSEVNEVAKNIKLYFGKRTYPSLISNLLEDKTISLSFFNHVKNRTLFFVEKNKKVEMWYQFKEPTFTNNLAESKFYPCKSAVPIKNLTF